MRYATPADVTGINLASGPLTVVDGFIEVPDDAGQGDLGGLAVYGFTPAPVDATAASPEPAPAIPAPARAAAPAASTTTAA